MENTQEQKRNKLFIILAGIFITNALLAEMIGVKIFSAESTLGLQPAHFNILGFTMDFNLTAGAVSGRLYSSRPISSMNILESRE